MLSKKCFQETFILSLSIIGFLIFSFNQKLFCTDRESDMDKTSNAPMIRHNSSNLLAIIKSLKESDLKKEGEIKTLLQKNQELEKIIKKQGEFVLNNCLQQSELEKGEKQTSLKEKNKVLSGAKEKLEQTSVYLKMIHLEEEIKELIEERNNLYSLTADPDGTQKIIKDIMQFIGINTDDLINCEGIIFAEKCLELLKIALTSAAREENEDDFTVFTTKSSSSYSSTVVSYPIVITNQSNTFSFNAWHQGFLSINTPWSKVICQRWTHNNLQSLDLYRNQIPPEGGKLLAEALKFNTSLLYLNLANNWLGNEGAKAMGEALKVNSTLLKFNFNLNKIENRGAEDLAEGLKYNTTLQFISLRYNKFTGDGKRVIKKNTNCKVDFKS